MMTRPLPMTTLADAWHSVQHALREGLHKAAKAIVKAAVPGAGKQPEDVAILFIDMVGSSRFAETMAPHDVMRTMQSFHTRMAARVAEHGGKVVSFTGDGLSAVFKARRSETRGAASALGCALDMLAEVERWSIKRVRQGKIAIPVGIGIHFGTVVMGPIGNGHLQRSVFGDSVNVAKRLETMTRTVGSPLVVSDAVVGAIKGELAVDGRLLSGLRQQGPTELRGRRSPVSIWILDQAAAAVSCATPRPASVCA